MRAYSFTSWILIPLLILHYLIPMFKTYNKHKLLKILKVPSKKDPRASVRLEVVSQNRRKKKKLNTSEQVIHKLIFSFKIILSFHNNPFLSHFYCSLLIFFLSYSHHINFNIILLFSYLHQTKLNFQRWSQFLLFFCKFPST